MKGPLVSDGPMAWISKIEPDEATDLLQRQYEAATKRAGKVFQIIQIQSLRPRLLRASTQLYLEAMYAEDSRLSRAQREMIATTVSRVNDCFY
jgi:alkylhydroperoxidase family enzyme